MTSIKVNKELIEELSFCDVGTIVEDWEYILDGEWVQDCKYQQWYGIFKQISTGKFYQWCRSRSGSYHTDWYYDDEYDDEVELYEVEKKVRVIEETYWKYV